MAVAVPVGVLLALGVVLLCTAQVSSDVKIEQDISAVGVGEMVVVRARGGNRRAMQEIDCGELCKVRCSLNSRPNRCKRACGTCCVRCKCVPPGTSGNRELCGTCYTGMTTHGNSTKCP
ncbi:Gibberellin regulated protein [Corchorus capsularis]|uniref:Gibberellin regulated protein n=1 Tax=Corchorus capsularis TaxID=210143 RepID=A0A1R3I4U1_COCAP|nr:Gibberellin regulated protein [Corchorus capsularis]